MASRQTKSISINALTRRLAESFPSSQWRLRQDLTVENVRDWLECWDEDVEALIAAGVLKAKRDDFYGYIVKATDLLRFIEANPWWFALRTKKHVARLRDGIEIARAQEARDRKRSRHAKLDAVRDGKVIDIKEAA